MSVSLPAQLALVAIGGAAGSVLRHLAALVLGASPATTLLVNVSGSFLIGWVLAQRVGDALTLLVAVGVLGGYTTFSTFEWQLLDSIRSGNHLAALSYALGSVVLGLLAVYLGFLLGARTAH